MRKSKQHMRMRNCANRLIFDRKTILSINYKKKYQISTVVIPDVSPNYKLRGHQIIDSANTLLICGTNVVAT